MQIHAERNTIIKDRDRTDSYSSFTHETIISLMIASCVKLEDLINIHIHVGAKPPPKCFVSSWVFHIISHCLKSIDSFYTKLGRWAGDLLPIIFTGKISVNVKVVTSQWWRHVFLATFEVFNMHIFYNVFERAHQGELKPEKILSISQKLNEIWHF